MKKLILLLVFGLLLGCNDSTFAKRKYVILDNRTLDTFIIVTEGRYQHDKKLEPGAVAEILVTEDKPISVELRYIEKLELFSGVTIVQFNVYYDMEKVRLVYKLIDNELFVIAIPEKNSKGDTVAPGQKTEKPEGVYK